MRNQALAILAAGLAAAVFSAFAIAQEPPKFPAPQKEHELLKQFVGEWESESEGVAGPNQPAMKCKGTMRGRMLGGFWVVCESQGEVMGMPLNAVQTIGYDPQKQKYVGTWVDSMMNHLWTYEGSVDATGKTLTLESTGPDMTQPGKTAKYRDTYEFKSPDYVVVTSSAQGADGKWVTFMTGQVRRKAAK